MTISEALEKLKEAGLSLWWEEGTPRLQAPWPPEKAPAEVAGLLEWLAENQKALEETLSPRLLYCLTCKQMTLHIGLRCQLCRPRPPGVCPTCGEADWWASRYGQRVCRICHPPPPEAVVIK